MLNNKPRGICFNKNALNIQPQNLALGGGLTINNENNHNLDNLKAAALSLENPAPLQPLAANNPIKKLNFNFNNKVNTIISDENAQLSSKPIKATDQLIDIGDQISLLKQQLTLKAQQQKAFNLKTTSQGNDENLGVLINKQQSLAAAKEQRQQDDAGRESPNEPSPPKLRSYSRNSLRQHLPQHQQQVAAISSKLITEEVVEQHQQLEDKVLPNLEGKPQLESNISRIPRLSMKFGPVLQQQQQQQLRNNNVARFPRATTGCLPTLAEIKTKFNNEQEDVVKMIVDEAMEQEEQIYEEIEDIDKSSTNSRDAIYLVCDVAKDIYEYMYTLEESQSINQDYLREQKIFTPKVRQRLVDWCIDIHSQLRLLPETLYMTIAVIDRYFAKVPVTKKSQVQLVAVGATLIASKYEEIYPPDVGDLMHLTQNNYPRREIMEIEIEILKELNFDLGRPIPPAFLRRFSKAAHCDLKMHSIAKYLMELSLTEYECSHWNPSMLAAAALYATLHLVHQSNTQSSAITGSSRTSATSKDRWNRALVHYSHYTGKQLREPAGILCKILKKSQKSPQAFTCVKKNLTNLAKWPELRSPRVDELIKLADQ